MSTDKTLADVKPGGRVRLGDGLPPLPKPAHESVSECGPDYFDASQMRAYARAALDARPENVAADTYWSLADMIEPHVCREGINPDGDLPASVYESVQFLLEHWLRTRQPVEQEPDAWVPDKFFEPGVNAMTARRKPSDVAIAAHGLYVPLFRHPASPAQAVDLGQFRPFVEAQRAEYISHGLTEEDYCVAECDDLLALIDSKAVGNK